MRNPTLAILLSFFLAPAAFADEKLVPATFVNADTAVTLTVAPVQGSVVDRYGEAQPARVTEPVYDRDGMEVARYEAPTLPYGAFFVRIDNPTTEPMRIEPAQLALVERGRTHAAVSDEKKLDARWQDALWADFVTHVRHHMVVPPVEAALHTRLRMLTGAISIAPKAAWQGYVVFDVRATERAEYDDFVRDAGQLAVTLETGAGLVKTTFVASR